METLPETHSFVPALRHQGESESAQILVVDAQAGSRLALCDLLQRRAYRCTGVANGEKALEQLAEKPYDLMLIDLEMPGLVGMVVAQRARRIQPGTEIIVLTDHGTLETALEGMHLGIFDYLPKTNDTSLVLSRIADAIAKRRDERHKYRLLYEIQAAAQELSVGNEVSHQLPDEPQTIVAGPIQISLWTQTVRIGEYVTRLTPTELHVLACLAQHAGQPLSYQQIVRSGMGSDVPSIQAAELIKPHIYHLRQKLEHDPSNPRYILTVRGIGYLLAVE